MDILHQLPLVSTIAISLSVAFVCGLIASKLKISPIVGYLLAGVIIGPYTPGFTGDMKIAEELSEILPSSTMWSRSSCEKLFSMASTFAREHEHSARSGLARKTRTPGSWKSR